MSITYVIRHYKPIMFIGKNHTYWTGKVNNAAEFCTMVDAAHIINAIRNTVSPIVFKNIEIIPRY